MDHETAGFRIARVVQEEGSKAGQDSIRIYGKGFDPVAFRRKEECAPRIGRRITSDVRGRLRMTCPPPEKKV